MKKMNNMQQQQQQQLLDDYFTVMDHDDEDTGGNSRSSASTTTVLQAPVRQEGLQLFLAVDGDSFASGRPGNGGIRLLQYESTQQAIADAVRLAQGMTRKHDMFRTGFSGAKLVVSVDPSLEYSFIRREHLMQDIATALEALQGSVYTGCDLNTSDQDMDFLVEATGDQYVLAGRNSQVDTNVATAASVIGSILGLCQASEEDIQSLVFTVQGCGKVGTTVAKELVRLGAKRVQTCDLNAEQADIPGCHPIADWKTTSCNFLVPCANSLAITEAVATHFPPGIRFCTGATNSPYASSKARSLFDTRGVAHVPESISSAGAILADSVEWYDRKLFQHSTTPALLYAWVRSLSQSKAAQVVSNAKGNPLEMIRSAKEVTPPRTGDPVGKGLEPWIQGQFHQTDSLIIGGGIAGTAAAYSLSKLGISSTLLEQGETLSPPTASSNGDSRMYRQMYSSEFFSKMQTIALDGWRDLEQATGESLLQENGLLFYGEDTGETVEGSVLGAKQTMEALGLPHTFYESGDAIADAFPALANCRGKEYAGVCEDTAGHIRASKACAAMVKAASAHCKVQTQAKVVALDVNYGDSGNKVLAVMEDGSSVIADRVILAAGPWTNKLLEMSELPQLKLKIWQVQWAHYRLLKDTEIPQAFHFRKATNNNDGGLYYVFPASATESVASHDESRIVKVGVDFPTGQELENMEDFDYQGSNEVLALMDGWVKEQLPVVGERVDSHTSPYTMTSDSFFCIDRFATNDKVSIFAGGSGRAFKFGPLLGDCLAAIATGREAPISLDRFKLDRFEVAVESTQQNTSIPVSKASG